MRSGETLWTSWRERGKGWTTRGSIRGHRKEELYRSVRGSVGGVWEKRNGGVLWHFSER